MMLSPVKADARSCSWGKDVSPDRRSTVRASSVTPELSSSCVEAPSIIRESSKRAKRLQRNRSQPVGRLRVRCRGRGPPTLATKFRRPRPPRSRARRDPSWWSATSDRGVERLSLALIWGSHSDLQQSPAALATGQRGEQTAVRHQGQRNSIMRCRSLSGWAKGLRVRTSRRRPYGRRSIGRDKGWADRARRGHRQPRLDWTARPA